MLPELHAERQLELIEAASVPHMTDDARRKVFGRYTDRLQAGAGMTRARTAHEALMAAGIRVVEVPRKRRDTPGRDERGKRA